MAKTIETAKVGQRVYLAFRPQMPGQVIDVLDPSLQYDVLIRWINGTVSAHSTMNLRDFDALIADHKKKLQGHLNNLDKLKKLEGKL